MQGKYHAGEIPCRGNTMQGKYHAGEILEASVCDFSMDDTSLLVDLALIYGETTETLSQDFRFCDENLLRMTFFHKFCIISCYLLSHIIV